VRHPAYSGSLLFSFGLVLLANSLIALAIFILFFIPWLAWRIRREEKALAEEFGKQFLDYKERTKLLVPKVF
jgi:protein-S-isoprenylcysteine O-methyltransferase Ste14